LSARKLGKTDERISRIVGIQAVLAVSFAVLRNSEIQLLISAAMRPNNMGRNPKIILKIYRFKTS
jgi:hypothetical protein